MSDKIKELLVVLNLPTEDQQQSWCWFNIESVHDAYYDKKDVSLADLAFRLRDEVLNSENGTIRWVGGMFDVYMKMTGSKLLNWKWGYIEAQPIHWIIAALIAKELAE